MDGKNIKKQKVRFPLSTKLIIIISVIVLCVTALVTVLASIAFANDVTRSVDQNNITLIDVFASKFEGEVNSVHDASLSLFSAFNYSTSETMTQKLIEDFFMRNGRIVSVDVPNLKRLYNEKFLLANEIANETIDSFLEQNEDALKKANSGSYLILNASPILSIPVLVLVAPYTEDGTSNRMVIFFASNTLQRTVQENAAYEVYAFSNDGSNLLVYPDIERLTTNGIDMNDPAVSHIMAATHPQENFKYVKDGKKYVAAFKKIEQWQTSVVSSIPGDLIYAAVYRSARQNIILAAVVLLASILAVYFFAKSISRPVIKLKDATAEIEAGNYDINLKPTTKDEIGLLTKSFVSMGKGLAERERLRETFGKFVNKEIAERATKGELKLGGERRVATIFFSDIRSFTAISEKMSPEGVVEFLNEYMTRMVKCIEKTNGIVDKFIGDAIMGTWGVPISQGSPRADAENAIRAMLMMRKSLIEYNADRGTPEKPLIKIGCGLNSGDVLAGQIGSSQRMEYTVIGDAVNTASRIEALNKPFGTDILISQNTYDLVKDLVITEPMLPIKVKGKDKPLQIYAVVNLKGVKGPQTLAEVRKLLKITPPATIKDPNEEEKKYEIMDQK
ncbi:MAG: adenylate/guanylate cyclase domain-containing protein [Treponema sp.]|nr:MAG: adenylate/guanylate cyclase domain-containing protein [Treponema sp.]